MLPPMVAEAGFRGSTPKPAFFCSKMATLPILGLDAGRYSTADKG
jgi:hypothetical protein